MNFHLCFIRLDLLDLGSSTQYSLKHAMMRIRGKIHTEVGANRVIKLLIINDALFVKMGEYNFFTNTDDRIDLLTLEEIVFEGYLDHNDWFRGIKLEIDGHEIKLFSSNEQILDHLLISLRDKTTSVVVDVDDLWYDLKKTLGELDLWGCIKEEETLAQGQDRFRDLVLEHARLVKIMKESSIYSLISRIDHSTLKLEKKLKTIEDQKRIIKEKDEEISNLREEVTNLRELLLNKHTLLEFSESNEKKLEMERSLYRQNVMDRIKKSLEDF